MGLPAVIPVVLGMVLGNILVILQKPAVPQLFVAQTLSVSKLEHMGNNVR